MFDKRLGSEVVELTDDVGEPVWVVPQTGNIVGSFEGPILFSLGLPSLFGPVAFVSQNPSKVS